MDDPMQLVNQYCQNHKGTLDEEIICKGDIHYCIWCGGVIGPCTCFNGFDGSFEEKRVLQEYILALERLFQRELNPIEKQALIQHYLDIREN
ncbi:MAG: hypothetical protein ACFFDI_01530 [Promethearchaeota archaeon]